MNSYLLVALGGAIGAVGRFALGQAFAGRWPGWPWGTLTVNVAGGFAMGLLAAWLLRGGSEDARLLLGVGVLGGFTTFSAFSLEMFAMIERGALGAALGYALLSVAGALAALALGHALVKAI
ncbi:fluoride efflux transporter CrcB [Sandaracinobacteroides saxicola]|uniref:Fluoride-specific ion channel FluC n=1 Tax=Sandaracinobacteroides saxicola TaxID=2759707 RepID=A0A7G5IFM5_9SPHN|nr:fluoride efflux transporter CrcB [Sandaracinobacteroides saxicola]QMW22167.1 fluoride efflux transporter CrcB [Sandaracinobacteroides saxicola]